MTLTTLSIAFVAVALVADGVIFMLLWERAIKQESMIDVITKEAYTNQY